MITRESFLQAYAIPPPVEPVGDAFVRAMTAGEKDRFDLAHTKAEGRDFRARLLAASVCNESGSLLFTDADLSVLSQLPLPTTEPIVDAVIRINRIGEKEREQLQKNLSGPNGDSSSVFVSDSVQLESELEARLTGPEWDEWIEFLRLEPLHDPYWTSAQICSVVANSQRAKGKAYTIDDFYPRTQIKSKSKPQMSAEQMLANFNAATAGIG